MEKRRAGWASESGPSLRSARRWVGYSTAVVLVLSLWAYFYPHPYSVLMWVLIAMPLWTIVLWRIFPDCLVLSGKVTEPRPKVFFILCFPWVVVSLRALIDLHLVSPNWTLAIPWLCCASAVVIVNLVLRQTSVAAMIGQALFSVVMLGPVLVSNYLLDSSPALRYPVTVTWVQKGLVGVSGWSDHPEGQFFGFCRQPSFARGNRSQ